MTMKSWRLEIISAVGKTTICLIDQGLTWQAEALWASAPWQDFYFPPASRGMCVIPVWSNALYFSGQFVFILQTLHFSLDSINCQDHHEYTVLDQFILEFLQACVGSISSRVFTSKCWVNIFQSFYKHVLDQFIPEFLQVCAGSIYSRVFTSMCWINLFQSFYKYVLDQFIPQFLQACDCPDTFGNNAFVLRLRVQVLAESHMGLNQKNKCSNNSYCHTHSTYQQASCQHVQPWPSKGYFKSLCSWMTA